LRVLVDHTSVEVFADNGLCVLTVNTFPDPAAVRLTPPVSGMKSFEVRRSTQSGQEGISANDWMQRGI